MDVQERFIIPFIPLLKANLSSLSESVLNNIIQALEIAVALCGFMLSPASNVSQKRRWVGFWCPCHFLSHLDSPRVYRKEKWVELWKPVASTLMKSAQTMKKGDPLRAAMEALISTFRKYLK